MERMDAKNVTYEGIELFGKPAILTDWRIDRNTVPKGFYAYDIRHDDDTWRYPVQMADNILVNFYGTVSVNEKVKLSKDGKRDMDTEDMGYTGDSQTLQEYMKQHPSLKKRSNPEKGR